MKLFLSHAAVDLEAARRFRKWLTKAVDVEVFLSSDFDSIGPAEDWSAAITRALDECDRGIVLATNHSIKRPWVYYEFGYLLARGKPVVPVCMGTLKVDQLPSPLNRRQAIHHRSRTGREALVQFARGQALEHGAGGAWAAGTAAADDRRPGIEPQCPRSSLVDEAEALARLGCAEKADALYLRAASQDDPDALGQFGRYLVLRGRLAQAEVVLQLAQERARVRHDRLRLGLASNALASLYIDEGQLDRATGAAEAARQELAASPGRDARLGLASSLDHLGTVGRERGRFDDAEPRFLEALKIRRGLLPDDHQDLALSLNNLAGLYRVWGRNEEALPLYERAKAILDLQPESRRQNEYARTLRGLGRLYALHPGRRAEAEVLLLEARLFIEAAFGLGHFLTARIRHDLGMLYFADGKLGKAKGYLEDALNLAEKSLGSDHPSLAYVLNGLGLCHLRLGHPRMAESLWLRALAIRALRLGPEHPLNGPVARNLASLYRSTGRGKDASRVEILLKKIRQPTPPVAHEKS